MTVVESRRRVVIRKPKPINRSVLDLARERIHEAFNTFDTVAVSFSGGKDSTAVLNLTIEVARERGIKGKIPTFFFDEECISLETVDYVRRVIATGDVDLHWYCLPVKHRNACTRKEPWWFPWAPEARADWVRELPPEAITYDQVPGFSIAPEHRPSMPEAVGLLFDPLKYGRVGMMMGIRAEESITRLRAVLMACRDQRAYIKQWDGGFSQGNLFKVYPIYDWRTEDVWTAPAKLGWDYNTTYDLMELAGISHKDQRCAPPFGEEPMQGLWMWASCFPEIWQKMCRRVPGAATAARYSRTELYSYGRGANKPDGMTWEQCLRHWIGKHPTRYQGEIANRLRRWIDVHYTKTQDPLAVITPHPVSGVSWRFLLNIAQRGDYKDRRQVNVRPDDYEHNKARYDAEIAKMRAAGEL